MPSLRSARPHPVVAVGLDASDGALAALRYAAEQARLRRWDLQVIHAFQVPSMFPELVGTFEICTQAASELVDSVLDQIGRAHV